jgi:hypothetical protein
MCEVARWNAKLNRAIKLDTPPCQHWIRWTVNGYTCKAWAIWYEYLIWRTLKSYEAGRLVIKGENAAVQGLG